MADEKLIKNTAEQIAAHKAAEEQWAKERTWPLYDIVLSGDPVEWVPRKDERYWEPADANDPNSVWVPKAAHELPKDAELKGGQVVRVARCTVTCHARNEETAKALALSHNPEYHTVESVKKVTS